MSLNEDAGASDEEFEEEDDDEEKGYWFVFDARGNATLMWGTESEMQILQRIPYTDINSILIEEKWLSDEARALAQRMHDKWSQVAYDQIIKTLEKHSEEVTK